MPTNAMDHSILEVTIEELAAAKEEIKALKAALLDASNELMQYEYVASHDLQEPLRKIQMFSGILSESATFSASEREIVDKILSSSSRMSALIRDILAYSKAGRTGKMFRPVDLNVLMEKIVSDFELTINEIGARIHCEKLPTITASALEMNQLFYNLIENALKFFDTSRTPEISIRCKKLSADAILEYIPQPTKGKTYFDISVRDNGVGFNTKYAEQIYKVFGRLHPKESYPGSGIGLSLCRSIIAKHEGHLFVESNPGEGSAFHVIIPE